MGVHELRQHILTQCDILQAILAFNYRYTQKTKTQMDTIRALALNSHAKTLRDIRDSIDKNVKTAARRFGCVQRPVDFTAKFISYSRKATGLVSLSKAAVDTRWFTNFCDGIDSWKRFPPHLQLIVSFERVNPPDHIRFDYLLTEAMLYEDMALAYNEAVALEPQTRTVTESSANISVKRESLFLRTAVLSAFYFVEAYLNGIGYDYYYRHERQLGDKEKTSLSEWDAQKDRRAWVSFERKVMDYPKIILKTQAPPFTTSNSDNLKILLGDAKDFRDAIVHQSPKTEDVVKPPEKVLWMLALRLSKVTPIVDAAVGFVKELNTVLGQGGMALDWLHSRDPKTGLFPPESFT